MSLFLFCISAAGSIISKGQNNAPWTHFLLVLLVVANFLTKVRLVWEINFSCLPLYCYRAARVCLPLQIGEVCFEVARLFTTLQWCKMAYRKQKRNVIFISVCCSQWALQMTNVRYILILAEHAFFLFCFCYIILAEHALTNIINPPQLLKK